MRGPAVHALLAAAALAALSSCLGPGPEADSDPEGEAENQAEPEARRERDPEGGSGGSEAGSAPGSDTEAPRGTLVITVEGFESDEGQALVNVFRGSDGFPNDPQRAWRALERPVEGGRVELVLEDVPAGSLAVSVFHDVDLDFELDKNLLGIPTERWGVSRRSRGVFGPPSYASAELDLAAGERREIPVVID